MNLSRPSPPACANSGTRPAASLAWREPVGSEPGITRIFSADMILESRSELESRFGRFETGLWILDLTRFLDANRSPPPDQVRRHASPENALVRCAGSARRYQR